MNWCIAPAECPARPQVDCGDIPISPYDNALAYAQIEAAYGSLLSRPTSPSTDAQQLTVGSRGQARDGREHPKIITLGGDHSVVLPILRSLNKVYGEISVIVGRLGGGGAVRTRGLMRWDAAL